MRDGVAAFYDPYASPFSAPGRLGLRCRRDRPLVSNRALAVGIALVALAAFVVADVGAFEAIPLKVTITSVVWTVGNYTLGNGSGFAVKGGASFPVRLACEEFCVQFTGVSVNAPFVLANVTIAYPYYEYVNATIVAPHHTFAGPLILNLSF